MQSVEREDIDFIKNKILSTTGESEAEYIERYGEVEQFDKEKMHELLEQERVDRVEVFKKDSNKYKEAIKRQNTSVNMILKRGR